MVPSCAEWRYDLKLRDTHIKGKNKFVLMDIPCRNFRMSKADKGASFVQLVAPPLHIVEASGSSWQVKKVGNAETTLGVCMCLSCLEILIFSPELEERRQRDSANIN